MQTGKGQLYSWSSQTHQRGGGPVVLRCNHTVIYEGQERRQGPLLQLLKVSGMRSVYNMFTLTVDFHITASLLVPGLSRHMSNTYMFEELALNLSVCRCLQRNVP